MSEVVNVPASMDNVFVEEIWVGLACEPEGTWYQPSNTFGYVDEASITNKECTLKFTSCAIELEVAAIVTGELTCTDPSPSETTVKYLVLPAFATTILPVVCKHVPLSDLAIKVNILSSTSKKIPSVSALAVILAVKRLEPVTKVWYIDNVVRSAPKLPEILIFTLLDIYYKYQPSQDRQSVDVLLPISPLITESVRR